MAVSVSRLARNGIRYIELPGNLYGKDLGYKPDEVLAILGDHGIKVSGICGMVYLENEFASTNHFARQLGVDYMRTHIEFCAAVGGRYILFGPCAVGRPKKYDDNEFQRAADTMRILGDDFVRHGIRGAIEPVRRDEVSLCHTFAEARSLIEAINHPGIQHIAGDVFHMLVGEEHIGTTIVSYGHMMTNLHLADTNRRALGTGMLDLDIVIMALYVAGYNNDRCFCSPEPLGTGANPYDQMYGTSDPAMLDELVRQTASYFYARERAVLGATDVELLGAY